MATPEPPDTYGKVTLGYDSIVVLPLGDALVLMKCFAKAERFQSRYSSAESRSTEYIGGALPSISLELMSGTDWITIKMNGEPPNER